MPSVPRLTGVDGRCFARVDAFECECPHCGRLILPDKQGTTRRRPIYNPHLQLLTCPWCESVFVVGLLLFQTPAHGRWRRPTDAPIDARPTREERLELARLAGGYVMPQVGNYSRDWSDTTPVNRVVEQPCRCPEKGWSGDCPVHGNS